MPGMKNILNLTLLLVVMVISISCSAASTNSSGSSGSGVEILFQDNFDSYGVATTWNPPAASGRDKSWGGANWDIADNSGDHYAYYNATSSGYLIYTNRTFTNFIYSVSMRPALYGIFCSLYGRSSGGNSYQLRFGGQTNINLYKVYNGGGNNAVLTNFPFIYTNSLYTVILGINGALITMVISNSATNMTVCYTDDGTTYGPVPTAGKIGVFVSYDSTHGPEFSIDNVMVTTP